MGTEHWQPSASIETLKARAQLNQQIRLFFTQRGYWEVETPVLAAHGVTDVYLSNIEAQVFGNTYYLQTSPEYHMKRMLAAGSGAIFQIARVFRDDELGRHHNPEFSLLEWYRPGFDHLQLIDEVADLLQSCIPDCPPILRLSYQQAFQQAVQINPHQTTLEDLKQLVAQYGLGNVLADDETDPDQYLFLLMAEVVEPWLAKKNQPVAIDDFPITQASLARVEQGVAKRFEIYYQGIELANGFYELSDQSLQRERFDLDNQKRQQKGLPIRTADSWLLQALTSGIPDCSGVALGLDRLYMLALNQPHIADVLAFSFERS